MIFQRRHHGVKGYPVSCQYSKTCVKLQLSKRPKICFSRPIIAECRSEVLQNAPRHSAILLTFIKLPFVIKIFVLSIF